MSVNIGLSKDQRKASVRILNRVLADEHVLYIKTRNYHWNVVGPRFYELHNFFEKQYELLAPLIDEVAERVRYLGGVALGTLREFVETTRLNENTGKDLTANDMLDDLLETHEEMTQQLRKDVADSEEDAGTQDFLTKLLEEHEKMAWMIRSMHYEREVTVLDDADVDGASRR